MHNLWPTNVRVTDRPLSLEQLAESEYRFRELVQGLPDGILVHSDNKVVFVNPCAASLFGAKSREELMGRPVQDLVSSEHMAAIKERIEQCYATGVAAPPRETVLVALDGSHVDVESTAIPICWDGAPAIEVVLRDIRRRKRAEREAEAARTRQELALRTGLRIGLWDWDIHRNKVWWCGDSYRQFGFRTENFPCSVEDATELLHPQDKAKVVAAFQDVLIGRTSEYDGQFRLILADRSIRWVDVHGVMLRNGASHMVGIAIDITEMKAQQDALRGAAEKYRSLFENTLYGVFLAYPNGTLLDVNPAMVKMLGYNSKEELLTRNLAHDIYENPEDRNAIVAKARPSERLEGVEVNWKRKDGKLIPVHLSGATIQHPNDSTVHYEVVVEDLTERRRLEEQYRHAQRMEAIGSLTGGIAHDFNNLLAVILLNVELIDGHVHSSQQRNVDAIKTAGNSAARLVRQLLAFSRKQVLYPTVLNINTVVADTVNMLQRIIGENIHVLTNLTPGHIASVRADRGQIEQVLMNLTTNARDAMPEGGFVTIETSNAVLGPEDQKRYSYVVIGPYVRLSVRDTGVGMSEEVKARIFEPFFTTKEKGRGTGLGLAMVYGIVKQSGGYIHIESERDVGTRFDIYLPAVSDLPLATSSEVRGTPKCSKGSETILLLEDNASLREVIREFLVTNGYNVIAAGRADYALDLSTQFKGPIPAMICDVILPDLSGPLAVERIRRVHPEARVIYISGYAEMPIVEKLVQEGAMLVQKPFSREDLLAKIAETLHCSGNGWHAN